jgi:hypothetical protein
MTGTNLFNAAKNELLPIVFDINNKYEFDVVAIVEFSKFNVRVRVWERVEEKCGYTIYVELEETGGKIVVNKKFSRMYLEDINTYADLVAALKKYLGNSHLNIKITMGRLLKRVPMDFDYPINEIWVGYLIKPSFCYDGDCELCKKYAKIKGIEMDDYCPKFKDYYHSKNNFDPPVGEGYQLWEDTTEGSPQSPVFATLDELCEWCEENATIFADCKADAARWKEMLKDNFFVHQRDGNMVFI